MNPWNIIGWGALGLISLVLVVLTLGVFIISAIRICRKLRDYRKYRATRNAPFEVGQRWTGEEYTVAIDKIDKPVENLELRFFPDYNGQRYHYPSWSKFREIIDTYKLHMLPPI